MNRFVWALLICALPLRAAQAQVSRFHGSLGLGGVLLRSTAPDGDYPDPNSISPTDGTTVYRLKTVDANILELRGSLGLELPVLRFSDDHALGVSLNACAGLLAAPEKADGFSARLLLDFPQFVTWRYGARATKKTEKEFGVGAGVGYRWARFFLPFNSPVAMVEGVYSGFDADWFLRLTTDLRRMQFYNEYSSEGLVPVLSIRHLDVTIGKTF